MTAPDQRRPDFRETRTLRVVLAIGAVSTVIGGLLLSIVDTPEVSSTAFTLGTMAAGCGVMLLLASVERVFWRRSTENALWRDISRALVMAMLVLIGVGLLTQVLDTAQMLFEHLIRMAPLLVLAMTVSHVVAARVIEI